MNRLIPVLLMAALSVAAAEAPKLKVLIVTGGHGFQREPFFQVFTDNPAIAFTEAKHTRDADAYERDDLLSHDVIVPLRHAKDDH
jgi:hypothetical protein